MSSYIRLQQIRKHQNLIRRKQLYRIQFLREQKKEMEKFNKFKKEIKGLKDNESSLTCNLSDSDSKKVSPKPIEKKTIKDNFNNDIKENIVINKKGDDSENYSQIMTNLNRLYKDIKQGNINLTINKKESK